MQKPVLIIQHEANVGPGIVTHLFDEQSLEWELVRVGNGMPLPKRMSLFSGMVILGGSMSVNDPLPFISEEILLVNDALRLNRPVAGHCLGGQILAKALGGVVSNNVFQEIGWAKIEVESNAEALLWTQHRKAPLHVFQWHYQTFSIPYGATPILSGQLCHNQAFVMGPNLAMQFHVEMDETLIRQWIADTNQWPAAGPGIQTVDALMKDTQRYLDQQGAFARILYAQWMRNL